MLGKHSVIDLSLDGRTTMEEVGTSLTLQWKFLTFVVEKRISGCIGERDREGWKEYEEDSGLSSWRGLTLMKRFKLAHSQKRLAFMDQLREARVWWITISVLVS